MSKLTINIGLPASGKSTESEKKILADGNTVRINKDLLRTMLHFDKFTGRNEGLTRAAGRALAKFYLANGTNVITDDTNLNPSTKQSWVDLAKECEAKVEYLDMTHISVAECIERDANRAKKVGANVIYKMALQHLNYMKGDKVIICDLDGTLCDIEHRRHFVAQTPKDWKGFFEGISEDTLREEVAEMVRSKNVLFVSARPENYRKETEDWLRKHGFINMLIMREAGDKRPDTEVKSDIYDKYLKNLDIVEVIDDRPCVIKMWQEKGLKVTDVGNGIDF